MNQHAKTEKRIKAFWDKTKKDGRCIVWTGCKFKGYGCTSFKGKVISAHRLAWFLKFGPILNGLTIDHLCRNRACVKVEHLELVTNKENVLRGIGITAQNKRKTHCKNGHPLSGDNLAIRKHGWRRCRICHRKQDMKRLGRSDE